MTNESKTGILGLLAGAAIGATLGLLFAPRSGRETRDLIGRKVRDGKDDLDGLIDKAHEEWSRVKGKATDTANMTREEVGDFVRFLFAEGRDLGERIRKDMEGTAEDLTERARKGAEQVKQSAN